MTEATDTIIIGAGQAGLVMSQQLRAAGRFRRAPVPDFAARLPPDIVQLDTATCRNPQVLPPGRCWSWAAAPRAARSPMA